jgi:hypothetical protein
MANAFPEKFQSRAYEGDKISVQIDGFDITARIVRDADASAPDTRDAGFWPSLDPKAVGYIGSKSKKKLAKATKRANAIMAAWEKDEWFYCGIVLSIKRNGVMLEKDAASLWEINCNYPGATGESPNEYLTVVADELLDEALNAGERALARLVENRVIVEIAGGNIQAVYAGPAAHVFIVDHDNEAMRETKTLPLPDYIPRGGLPALPARETPHAGG